MNWTSHMNIQEKVVGSFCPAPSNLPVLDSTVLEIAQALRAKVSDGGWIARCPRHKDREPSLRISEGEDGRIFIDCCAGCSFEKVRAALATRGLWSSRMSRLDPAEEKQRRLMRRICAKAEQESAEWFAGHHWDPAMSIEHEGLVERYLCSLGFKPPYPQTLREGCDFFLEHRGIYFSLVAMACRYPSKKPVCIQALPLTWPGVPAWKTRSRVIIGSLAGAAVQLSPWQPGRPLILVEGVKEGLAVARACRDAAVWAVLEAANAVTVQVPAGASVTLCLGEEKAQRKAAALAAVALQRRGHAVQVAKLPVDLAAAAPVQGVAR